MTKETIIIGAGPGGLASAILLASAGVKVKIIERLPVVGGRTSNIEADGYKFDLGPTFFLYPRVLEEIFRAAGTSLRDEVEMVRLDPQYRIQFGTGGHLDCTPNIAEMEKQIAALSPADAPGFRRFLNENRTKLAAMEPCLESPFLGWQDLVQMRLLKMLPMLRPHQSVDTYLKRFFKDERVRLAFCFQSKYLGMSPFRCPSLFSILSFLEYEYGVFHPIGGCAAITAAMARVAQRLGVEIGENEHESKVMPITLKPEHRVRHMHVIGASGTGKSTLLLNLICQDIYRGNGVAVLDPHGDLVDKVLSYVPPERFRDVILFDPSDEVYPVGFNILSAHSNLEKNLLASDLVGVFRRLSTSWGDQMTSVLGNAILAFLESSKGGTLARGKFSLEGQAEKCHPAHVPSGSVSNVCNN